MVKTAIENKQNLIVEGCYIPFDWQKDFDSAYLESIRYYCLVMSEPYIKNHFADIKKYANVIESRLDDEGCTIESVLSDNAEILALAQKYRVNYILIDDKYENTLAKKIFTPGVNDMSTEDLELNEYSRQAKTLYGKTDAYKEYSQKSATRTAQQETALGAQVMDFFARLGKLRSCDPGCEEAQLWAKELQTFFTEHYYTCTPQILSSLAQSYADGGSMTENIDKVGGAGTGAFAKEVIDCYLSKQA